MEKKALSLLVLFLILGTEFYILSKVQTSFFLILIALAVVSGYTKLGTA